MNKPDARRMEVALAEIATRCEMANRGQTHWPGCQKYHAICAVYDIAKSAITPCKQVALRGDEPKEDA